MTFVNCCCVTVTAAVTHCRSRCHSQDFIEKVNVFDSRAFLKLDNVKANSDVEAELRFEFAIEDLPNQKGGKTTLAGCAGKADVRTDGQAYDAG